MRIGIATFGCDGGRSGIGQYLLHLLRGFAGCKSDDQFETLVLDEDYEVFGAQVGDSSLTLPNHLGNPLINVLWHQMSLPVWCWRRRYDVLFLAAANRRLPFALPCPAVGTVHDLAPMHLAAKYDRFRQLYVCRVLPLLVRRLQRVITVSECSKADVVHYASVAPERVTVVYNGVNHGVYKPADLNDARQHVRKLLKLDAPYLLYVSRLEHPGKNHVRLIEAFEILKNTFEIPHRLVLVGADKERAEVVHDAAARSSASRDIIFTGFMPDEDLPALYQSADAFILPSLYEGFGLPIVEAMACATPVVCANAGAMPEVAGGAALLVDPYSVHDIVRSVMAVLHDVELRHRCVRLGLQRAAYFNWTRTAEQTLAVLHRAVRERRSSRAKSICNRLDPAGRVRGTGHPNRQHAAG